MHRYPESAVERTMNVQEVVLRAMSAQVSRVQAGEILGLPAEARQYCSARAKADGEGGFEPDTTL